MPRPRSLTLSIALVWFAVVPGALAGQTREHVEEDVLESVKTFLAGLHAQDTVMMAGVVIDTVTRFTLLRSGPDGAQVVAMSAADFMKAVTRPNQPPLEELIRNPVVTIDADLATVWAEYQVRINGALSHCGYDAFHLARLDGAWKIMHVSDTARREGCGAMWPGSPGQR